MDKDENFAAKFHTYEVLWNQTGIHYTIDDEYIGGVNPPAGGFWQLGGSPGENIWENGTFMAPFDRPVYYLLQYQLGLSNKSFRIVLHHHESWSWWKLLAGRLYQHEYSKRG